MDYPDEMERAAVPVGSAALVSMPVGASKNRGPHLAHGSWRLIGGLAAVSSARGGRRSPVVGATGWRGQTAHARCVRREVHRLRSIPLSGL